MASSPGKGGPRAPTDDLMAVVDLGSNTARLAIFDMSGPVPRPVAGARYALKLMRAVGADGRLSDDAQERIRTTLDEFVEIARDHGLTEITVVGTSALRDSRNGPEFVEDLRRDLGIDISLVDGDTEARLSFRGAVSGLLISNGVVVDIGGGSLELARFAGGELTQQWMVPLGSLRMSDRFLTSDPPTAEEMERLTEHVSGVLAGLGVAPLAAHEVLVGAGGTIRNIASTARTGKFTPRAFRSFLTGDAVVRTRRSLADVDEAERAKRPGLSSDRADSIVGGALVLETVFRVLGGSTMVVSPRGLREGVAIAKRERAAPAGPVTPPRHDAVGLE